MTLSSTLEMKLREREGSTAPADAAAKVLGIQPKWGATELGVDAMHHLVYVTATSVAYAALDD
jgi:hypothetical protein